MISGKIVDGGIKSEMDIRIIEAENQNLKLQLELAKLQSSSNVFRCLVQHRWWRGDNILKIFIIFTKGNKKREKKKKTIILNLFIFTAPSPRLVQSKVVLLVRR